MDVGCVCVFVNVCLLVRVFGFVRAGLFDCVRASARVLLQKCSSHPYPRCQKRGGVLVSILGWEPNCARRRAQCDGHVHTSIRKKTTCIQFRSSWNLLLSRYAPRARLRRLCDPLGEFVGSGSFARRGISYRGVRLARRGHPNKTFKTHLPRELPSQLARRMRWHGAKRVIQRMRNFRVLAAPPRPLAPTAPSQRSVGNVNASFAFVNN